MTRPGSNTFLFEIYPTFSDDYGDVTVRVIFAIFVREIYSDICVADALLKGNTEDAKWGVWYID